MTTPGEPVALMACQRNEGIHILEWVAYHRVIGFDPILLCSNDCEDGSDRLLDALASAGAVRHVPNPAMGDHMPQDRGIRRVLALLRGGRVDWLGHLDLDEFLNIAPGAAPVQHLIARAGTAHAIALPWRSFGDSGHADWPGQTLPAFTACEAEISDDRVKFKSIFRVSAFAHASEHMPTAPLIDAPVAVNGLGQLLSSDQIRNVPRARYQPIALARAGAVQVNHYAIRSQDVFLLKNNRGFGSAGRARKYNLNSDWHRRANRNEAQDRSILARWPETAAEIARLRALPGVTAAEDACRDWFLAARTRLLTPDNLRRWTNGDAA